MTIEQYNARLRELVDQMARRHKLKAVVSDLEEQRRKLADQVQALKKQTYQEQLDVDRLENMSAAKLFYQITGRLEGQLEKEQAELYAAALRYDGKRKELHALEADLEERRRELVKGVYKYCEEAKIAVRSIRRDAMDKLKDMKKKSEITEDDLKNAEKKMQTLTDRFCKEIDETAAAKDKEIMEI